MIIFRRLQTKFIFILGCFMTFMLIAVLATLTIVQSQTSDATTIGIAARQQTLILTIQNQTNALILALESESSTKQRVEELTHSVQLFGHSLQALLHGGTAEDIDGQLIELPATSPAIAEKLLTTQQHWQPTEKALQYLISADLNVVSDDYYDALDILQNNWAAIFENSRQVAVVLEKLSNQKVYTLKVILLSTLALTVIASLLTLWLGKRTLIRPMSMMIHAMQGISQAEQVDFKRRLPDFGVDEVGDVARLVNDICEKLQLAHDETQASNAVMSRIKQALDNTATGALIIDSQETLIYCNKTAESILNKNLKENTAESLMNQPFSQLKTHLVGSFPETLSAITNSFSTRFTLANTTELACKITPVIDKKQQQLGWIMEWRDITIEVLIEQEINHVVTAAAQGNFSARIRVENKKGFFLTLSQRMNEILTANQTILTALNALFEKMATGHLTETLQGDFHGSLAELKQNINLTMTQLNQTLSLIQHSAGEVDQAADSISADSDVLNAQTSQHAASLEEIAASIEQMTGSMQQNAAYSQELRQLTQQALEKTQQGNEVVNETINAMLGIAESSRRVADITTLIDEIAFQTNLLALNAAVEAARAGEHGRSFAVVASEVRQLAQRSATAAKDIRHLIQESTHRIDRGYALTRQSETTLGDIQQIYQRVLQMVQDIANSSMEQSEGIQLINRAIAQMDQLTQQNVTLVENANKTSLLMKNQANQLNDLIQFFQLNHHR
jgi:methyl-accepting chemotaxis protein